jgi:uncharacterized iron-regulated membrane protein
MSQRPIKAALLQVHSVIGLTFSLVLALIGITGAMMSFEDEIGAFMNVGIMQVEARPAPRLTPDALVARRDGGHGPGERLGGVVRAVVGDHADHSVDAVGGEERPGAVKEPDRGGGLLVAQVLGVGKT